MLSPKPVIFGFSGLVLTSAEEKFFTKCKPLGFILFARNCDNPDQIKKLTSSLREIAGKDALILIDQEGGRVARLKPPHWRKYPSAKFFADIAADDLEKAENAVYHNYRQIADDLINIGINVNCAPVLDLVVPGCHDIIGDRSFGECPKQIVALGKAACKGLLDGGVLPIIKHIPGHGRAYVDSHESLPIVDASLDTLRNSDFIPFKQLSNSPLAMTAHIIYSAIDSHKCATLSKKVISIIRNEIGFNGLLITDDLSMKALDNMTFAERTTLSLQSGCDIVLHCNGNMSEMTQIAKVIPQLSDASKERLTAALNHV